MNKNIIYAIILGILILVSVVQAYQLTTLKAKIDAGAVKIAGKSSALPASSGGASSGSDLNSLPTMVGGC